MHFHRWTNWKDVKLGDQIKPSLMASLVLCRQVITQERRCKICNLVKARTT